jgi:hypothetical protein
VEKQKLSILQSLVWSDWLKRTIYRTRGVNANHYIIDTILYITKRKFTGCCKMTNVYRLWNKIYNIFINHCMNRDICSHNSYKNLESSFKWANGLLDLVVWSLNNLQTAMRLWWKTHVIHSVIRVCTISLDTYICHPTSDQQTIPFLSNYLSLCL